MGQVGPACFFPLFFNLCLYTQNWNQVFEVREQQNWSWLKNIHWGPLYVHITWYSPKLLNPMQLFHKTPDFFNAHNGTALQMTFELLNPSNSLKMRPQMRHYITPRSEMLLQKSSETRPIPTGQLYAQRLFCAVFWSLCPRSSQVIGSILPR